MPRSPAAVVYLLLNKLVNMFVAHSLLLVFFSLFFLLLSCVFLCILPLHLQPSVVLFFFGLPLASSFHSRTHFPFCFPLSYFLCPTFFLFYIMLFSIFFSLSLSILLFLSFPITLLLPFLLFFFFFFFPFSLVLEHPAGFASAKTFPISPCLFYSIFFLPFAI